VTEGTNLTTAAGLQDLEAELAVLEGDGPCNRQRIARRTEAHHDGAWVREAAAAYQAKKNGAAA